MAAAVSQLLERGHRRRNPVRHDVTAGHLMRGRSVGGDAFEDFVRAVVAPRDRFVVATSLPRYWRRTSWNSDHVERPELSARKEEADLDVSGHRVSFRTLPPEFDTLQFGSSLAQWANVTSIRSWALPELAEVIPNGLDSIALSLAQGTRTDAYRCSSEGVTVLQHADGDSLLWSLPDGLAVFKQWLTGRYDVSLSSAGRMARRLMRVLGGPEYTRAACSPAMIKLFHAMAASGSRSVAYQKFWGAVRREFGNHDEVASRVLRRWIDAGVVDVGLHVACTECLQTNWYPVDGLTKRLQCHRCLETFAFPLSHPNTAVWAVRPLGPFAVEGHAHGAFTVALTIRLLRLHGSRARTTWAPGLQLTDPGGQEREVDLAMLWQEEGPWIRPMNVVLGECKTFGDFEVKDIRRMRSLARSFPGAYLVFSTLKDELSPGEVRLIRPLAQAGRKGWRNPVMVLTAGELANDWNPPVCWRTGKAASIAARIPPLMTLLALADATEQIHLGLGPGQGWPHRQPWQNGGDAPHAP